MTITIRLPDGTALRTASRRRYVLFAVYEDGTHYIVRRSDSLDRLRPDILKIERAALRRRAVVIDTAEKAVVG